jgi:phosphonate transport system substrate-binding protein
MITGSTPSIEKLTITSIQAPNQDWIAADLAKYLSLKLGIHCEFIADSPWQEREHMLDAGQIDMGWICGLPYVQKIDQADVPIELLATPVMRGARYQGRPIYFSDVIVRSESSFRSFGDLRGGLWAYNEPNSHSGYNLTRYMLVQMGEFNGFFGSVIEAGSHQAALQMLLDGKIEGTSIDSTVLEIELRNRPEISKNIRTIATWGPSPIPPWVIHKKVPANLRARIRRTLLEMESDLEGKAVLADLGMKQFVRVSDADYDPIREMATRALRGARLEPVVGPPDAPI